MVVENKEVCELFKLRHIVYMSIFVCINKQ